MTLERVLCTEMLAAESAVVAPGGEVERLQVVFGPGVVPEGAPADGAGEEGCPPLVGLYQLPHILGRQLGQRVACACAQRKRRRMRHRQESALATVHQENIADSDNIL